jgi:hypothetical protein
LEATLRHPGIRGVFREQKLINDEIYDEDTLDQLVLMGENSYDVAIRYSEELKDLVRRCLRWNMDDRPSLDKLKTDIGLGVEATKDAQGYDGDDDLEEVFFSLPEGVSEFRPGQVYNGNGTRKRERSDQDVD